jgi:hypothetical protein
MKKRNVKLKALGLSLVLMFMVNTISFATEYTKVKTKSFDVNPGALLDIKTEFGDIKAHNWNKNKISVEATITVNASSQSKADERFERVRLEMSGNPDLVSILSHIESKFFKKGSNSISIDFLIYYPADCRLKLNQEFGSAFFEDVKGHTDIHSEYGSFNAHKLYASENDIEVSFGKIQVFTLNNANIDVDYGGCDIESVKTLVLRSSFSGNVNIDQVDDLTLKSSYDKVSIGEANQIHGSTEFSSFSLQQLNQSIKMKAAYGSFKIYSIASDFDVVDLNSEFCGLKLYVDEESNFTFYTDVQLGSFHYPKEKVRITDLQKDVTDLTMEGYFGSQEKAKSHMRLSVDNASINLNIK